MEPRHFELERGYLNIDSEGLYLSPSGNWQEARATPERSRRNRTRRTAFVLFGLLLIGSRALLEFIHMDGMHANSLALGLGIAGAGLLVLVHRFRHDLAPAFRIPFAKVRVLEAVGDRLTLHFVNADGREDRYTLVAPPEAIALARKAFEASRR